MKKKKGQSQASALASAINLALKSDTVGLASENRFAVEKIPTGSLTMDRITGGGFPRGRHVEIYGDYAAGKSYIMYRTMALAQARGEICCLIDGEGVFEPEWFESLGGDPTELIYYRPQTAEQLIEVLMLFVMEDDGNPRASVVGIDSVASLLPKEELEKRPTEGDDRTASRARMMSRLLRRVTTVNDKTLFLWTNQLIDKVSGYGGTTTPGGRALKFYASVRIEMKKLDGLKKPRDTVVKGKKQSKDTRVGFWVAIRAEKQKTAKPELESMFLFDIERGKIDPEYEVIHLGLEDGWITRSGNIFSYTDTNDEIHSGLESKFRKILRDKPEVYDELVDMITEASVSSSLNGGDDENGEPEEM